MERKSEIEKIDDRLLKLVEELKEAEKKSYAREVRRILSSIDKELDKRNKAAR